LGALPTKCEYQSRIARSAAGYRPRALSFSRQVVQCGYGIFRRPGLDHQAVIEVGAAHRQRAYYIGKVEPPFVDDVGETAARSGERRFRRTRHRQQNRPRSLRSRTASGFAGARRLLDDGTRIGAAESERVDGGASRPGRGRPWSELTLNANAELVEIDVWIGHLEMQVGRNLALPHAQHGLEETCD